MGVYCPLRHKKLFIPLPMQSTHVHVYGRPVREEREGKDTRRMTAETLGGKIRVTVCTGERGGPRKKA